MKTKITCSTCIGATYRESFNKIDSLKRQSQQIFWAELQSEFQLERISQAFASDKILTIKVKKLIKTHR